MYDIKSENEEISRWTLEVHLRTNDRASQHWWIAFTNPTAGPWKRLMTRSDAGNLVEVYRFGRDEERPDLILVSDTLRIVLIVEAKDHYRKLISDSQMKKSVSVIAEMTSQLQAISQVEAWRSRTQHHYVAGFLWGRSVDLATENRRVVDSFLNITGMPRSTPIVNFAVTQEENTLFPRIALHGQWPVDIGTLQSSFGV